MCLPAQLHILWWNYSKFYDITYYTSFHTSNMCSVIIDINGMYSMAIDSICAWLCCMPKTSTRFCLSIWRNGKIMYGKRNVCIKEKRNQDEWRAGKNVKRLACLRTTTSATYVGRTTSFVCIEIGERKSHWIFPKDKTMHRNPLIANAHERNNPAESRHLFELRNRVIWAMFFFYFFLLFKIVLLYTNGCQYHCSYYWSHNQIYTHRM